MSSKDTIVERFKSVRTFVRKKPRDPGNVDVEAQNENAGDPFDIPRTKAASPDTLKKWRQVAIVLNATRRFRYTSDLKHEEKFKNAVINVLAHSVIILDYYHYLIALAKGIPNPPLHPPSEYEISLGELASLTRDRGFASLMSHEGVEGLAAKLKSDHKHGISLDAGEVLKRKTVFGSNLYRHKNHPMFWNFVWDACRNLTLMIVLLAAAICGVLDTLTKGFKEGWYDGVSIAAAVFIDILVTATSDYFQSLQFHKQFDEKRNIHVEVIRGGTHLMISISDIVVGDVLRLKAGDEVPADGILISGHSLSVVELSLTGEYEPVDKGRNDPFLLSGCLVTRGCCTMLVTSVGINTEWGLIMHSISDDLGEETPLQVRLNGMATFIGLAVLLVAASLSVALLIRYFNGHSKFPDVKFTPGKTTFITAFDGVIKILTVAVTIMVVAVPEGLPLALHIVLAYSVRKLMKDQAMVRSFSSCETMGSATTICINKSGTLTTSEMTVVEAFVGGEELELSANRSALPYALAAILMENLAHNTAGTVLALEVNDSGRQYSGSPIDKAILKWGVKLGMNFHDERSSTSIIHIWPFNSEKRRGGVAVKSANSDVNIHWKGAAETVLASCTTYINRTGEVVPIDDEKMGKFKKVVEDMAKKGFSCVSIAGRTWESEDIPTDEEELANCESPPNDLRLYAILGLEDPCKPGVKSAVQLCSNAGIKVRLVTGDNIHVAKAIASEIGIVESNVDDPLEVLEGRVFREMTDADRLQNADKFTVIARASPSDKLLLVQMLRKKGNVVAATGNDWNDVKILMEADIGLATGIHGIEATKDISDIFMLDDNLDSVVKVIRWGRSVYTSIQKFCQFQMTIYVAALLINLIAAFSTGDVPLSAVQLLWVKLITDTFGALALAIEAPSDNVMRMPPIDQREPLITSIMWMNILVQVIYQVTVVLVLNSQASNIFPFMKHYSADHALGVKKSLVFNAFVFCQVFNELNARNPFGMNVFKGITKAYTFMLMTCVTIGLQVIIIMFLGKFFSTVRLSWTLWLVSVLAGFISCPLAAVFKLSVFFITTDKLVLANNLKKYFFGVLPEDSSPVRETELTTTNADRQAPDNDDEMSPLRF